MFVGSFAVHTAMVFTFGTLLLGFIGLDLEVLAGMTSIKTLVALRPDSLCPWCILHDGSCHIFTGFRQRRFTCRQPMG